MINVQTDLLTHMKKPRGLLRLHVRGRLQVLLDSYNPDTHTHTCACTHKRTLEGGHHNRFHKVLVFHFCKWLRAI